VYSCLLFDIPPLPTPISFTPTKSNLYYSKSPNTDLIMPNLQRLLTFQVPNLMSFFHCLVRAKESVQFRGAFKHFVKKLVFLRWSVVSPTSNTEAGIPPLVGCPRLLIYSQLPSVSRGLPSIRNLRMRYAVVTRTHLTWWVKIRFSNNILHHGVIK
jgi:hypothetical protein